MRAMARKHISWKTKCAAALLDAMAVRERFGLYPGRWYDDAKQMNEDQFLSLFHWDHNILHTNNAVDEFWNLTPMLIAAHRAKTKQDAGIIAKSKRIRFQSMNVRSDGIRTWNVEDKKRKIRSRGFDKTRTRHMDGTVTRRK